MNSYRKSGVNIIAGNKLVDKIKPLAARTKRPEVLSGVGGFGSAFKLMKNKYKNPLLVSSSDGVGTKLLLAKLANKHDTVGVDLVAMSVNDILCMGAEPLFFLDYVACGKLKVSQLSKVVKGIALGCKEAGCALLGGETAEMPGMYKEDDYDLAGFCVGAVDKYKLIDGSKIKSGDVIIGLESNGLHSNGFSLVRKIFFKDELRKLSKELLKPTKIYVKPVLSLLKKYNKQKQLIKGIAHVTGGAYYEKIPRIIPKRLCASIDKGSWPVPGIFRLIQKRGEVSEKEMYRTFNMGLGMVLVVDKSKVLNILKDLKKLKLRAFVIGCIVKGKKKVELV